MEILGDWVFEHFPIREVTLYNFESTPINPLHLNDPAVAWYCRLPCASSSLPVDSPHCNTCQQSQYCNIKIGGIIKILIFYLIWQSSTVSATFVTTFNSIFQVWSDLRGKDREWLSSILPDLSPVSGPRVLVTWFSCSRCTWQGCPRWPSRESTMDQLPLSGFGSVSSSSQSLAISCSSYGYPQSAWGSEPDIWTLKFCCLPSFWAHHGFFGLLSNCVAC